MFCSCTIMCFQLLGPAEMEGISLEKAYPEIHPSAARQTQFQRTVMTDVSENACQLAKQGSLKKKVSNLET